MTGVSRLVRTGLYRVTRHDAVRSLYERLDDAGVVLAQLDHFKRETSPAARDTGPPEVTLTTTSVTTDLPPALADEPLAPGDTLVVAQLDGKRVGWCLLSDRPVYVPELRRRVRFPGTYLWRLYVVPAQRGRGIGSAVVGHALRTAADCGSETLSALVAPDNLPSRQAFRGLGFHAIERYTTVGLGTATHHRCRQLEGRQ